MHVASALFLPRSLELLGFPIGLGRVEAPVRSEINDLLPFDRILNTTNNKTNVHSLKITSLLELAAKRLIIFYLIVRHKGRGSLFTD